jgi:hypothetical protein
MGAMAIGILFGWACSGVTMKSLSTDPPDASAQDPDGGGGSGIRVLEFDCPDPTSVIEVTTDDLAVEEMMLAHVWLCGLESSSPVEDFPITRCRQSVISSIRDNRITAECGTGTIDGDEWTRALVVRVYAPVLH